MRISVSQIISSHATQLVKAHIITCFLPPCTGRTRKLPSICKISMPGKQRARSTESSCFRPVAAPAAGPAISAIWTHLFKGYRQDLCRQYLPAVRNTILRNHDFFLEFCYLLPNKSKCLLESPAFSRFMYFCKLCG